LDERRRINVATATADHFRQAAEHLQRQLDANEDCVTDAMLTRCRNLARTEFGRSAYASKPIGYGPLGLAWTVERFIDGQTRRYRGLTFAEAMDNARNDVRES
jgi:hypothetical protein